MIAPPTAAQLDAIAQQVRPGSTLRRSWRLEGGVSAQVTAIELELPDGRAERVVVRRHGEIDKWHNPDIARDEFRLLSTVHSAGLRVPTPLYVDEQGEILGDPCLVVSFVDGTTEIVPEHIPGAIHQMAVYLSHLHALPIDTIDVAFLPEREGPIAMTLQHLQGMDGLASIRDTLDQQQSTSTNAPALLHGDFWPGNVMWRDGHIEAVLDWEDAAIGDPVADLASSRLELLWKFDTSAMEAFTRHYLAMAPIDLADLPLWELASASGAAASMGDWGLDPDAESAMCEKAHWFMGQALQSLSERRSR